MKIHPTTFGGPVTAGDAALPFYLQDVQGNLITLTPFRGKMLLLCLYRSPDCPQCGLRLLHLVQAYPHLQAQGVEMVVVFEALPERVRYHTAPLFPPFPLVADPERRVFQWYGVQSPWWGLRGALRLGAYWQAWRAHVGEESRPGTSRSDRRRSSLGRMASCVGRTMDTISVTICPWQHWIRPWHRPASSKGM